MEHFHPDPGNFSFCDWDERSKWAKKVNLLRKDKPVWVSICLSHSLVSTSLSILKIFPFTSLFLGKVTENQIRIWDFSVKGGESSSCLQVTFPVCKGRLTMFIWQRALGLGYYLKCFETGNTLPGYIFIFTASNAKNWKGALIRELAFTFSSASHLTLQTSLPAQEMRDSVSSDSSPSWLWTAAASRAQ